MPNTVEFESDGVRISGPRRTDGGYTVSFELGEYQSLQAAKLLAFPHKEVLNVSVKLKP